MTYRSRIAERQTKKTVDVVLRTLTAGKNVESDTISSLTPTHYQMTAFEVFGDVGAGTEIVDVFWFEPVSGSLPAITEKHIIEESTGTRYEVTDVMPQPENEWLKVVTRRLR